ncbi:response regulator [Streptomyces sp. NBC_01619]|uniref:response regulator n=1 Tax=Streptomyces sp. NBC_01619 TaxID=2975901 RepID=UPI0022596B69|nr:response regulator [Streptomyces sp. NBC_01619]MCX4515375.1 response regulator [Streptomyces sp. NBC_01619]
MTTYPTEKCSILIVDDIEENLIALEALLGPLGQELVRAHSGEEALKAMLRQDFAVVLLDVLMPGMDGFETAANIKRLDQTKDVPIILLTGAEVETDYAYRGYSIGAADFLTKPFDPWLLRTKVSIFLDLHRKNRQLAAQAEQLRRLFAEARTAPAPAPRGRAASAEAEATAERREKGARGKGPPPPETSPRTATAPTEERLAEIGGQLAQIELLLRDTNAAEAPTLADRVAELERAVGSLRLRSE